MLLCSRVLVTLMLLFDAVYTVTPCPSLCRCRSNDFEAGQTVECRDLNGDMDALEKIVQDLPDDTHALALINNEFSTLPRNIIHSETLQMLNLGNNQIRSIAIVIDAIAAEKQPDILNLRLHGNKIEKIPSRSLENLTGLQALDFNDNAIGVLYNDSLAGLANLMALSLANNRLTGLPEGFVKNCPLLESLDLSRNKISTLRADSFEGLVSLMELNFNDNHLRRLEAGVFSDLPSLLFLSITHNRLHEVPVAALESLSNLQELDIGFNRIKRISNHLSRLTSVVVLILEGNEISDIAHDALDGVLNMSTINLDGNKLKTITSETLNDFSSFQYGDITFYSNPFICDCKLEALARWIKEHSNKTYGLPIPTCVWPYHQHGIPINDLEEGDLECGNYANEQCSSLMSEPPLECSELRSDQCAVTEMDDQYKEDENCLCHTNDDSCYICPAGSYGEYSTDNGECNSCPVYSTSPFGSTVIDECVCIEGYTLDSDGNCTACPRGYFKEYLGPEKCSLCVNGKAVYSGSTTCSCFPGYKQNNNNTCSACPANTYKAFQGYGDCLSCPTLSTSAEASRSLHDCVCTVDDMKLEIVDGVAQCVRTVPEQDPQIKSSIMYLLFVGVGLIVVVAIAVAIIMAVTRRCIPGSDLPTMGSSSTCNTYVDERSNSEIQLKETDNKTPTNSMDESNGLFMQDPNYVKWEFPRKDLDIVGVVGHGAFGQVLEAKAYHLMGKSEPYRVAVKTLKKNAMSEEREALKTELDQLIYVGYHPNIISLLGASTSNGDLMIIMEYAEYGNLQSFLKSRCCVTDYLENFSDTPALSESDLLSFAWQVARGMSHLASVKCVHRDLAARNVLVSDGMVAKLSDFGLAREIYESGYYFKESKGRLPYKWMAPEAILFGQYTTKSDVWSYGILLWEIVTQGGTPYPGVPIEHMLPLLESGYRMSKPPSCRQQVYDIMLRCWHKKPTKRPSAEELHQIFDQILQSTSNQEYVEVQPDMRSMTHMSGQIGSQSSEKPLLITESDIGDVIVEDDDSLGGGQYEPAVNALKDQTDEPKLNANLSRHVYMQHAPLLTKSEVPQMNDTHLKIDSMMKNLDYPTGYNEGNQQCSDLISQSLCVVDVQ